MKCIFAAAFAALLCAAPAAAEVSLSDTASLHARSSPAARPAASLMARNKAKQLSAPLADTLPYREDLKINPTGVVVVIADSDARSHRDRQGARALQQGEGHLRRQGRRPHVAEVTAGYASSGMPGGFIIPKNNCESGTAIQQY
ncbi:MAG: hypothetical protein M5R42_06535 [Rhodocyclaceae bacterium]|nr:hypothetical protein [Rhodocyclaceae bacterium]